MPNSYGHYGILPAKFPFKDFSLDLAQQEGSRDFRIQKRGRRLYRLAGARELSHLPMCFLALFPNGIERQIWRQSLRIHNTVQNGRFARPERALEGGCEGLGAHNTLCATTKRHAVVCRLYGTRDCLLASLNPAAAAIRSPT